MKNVQLICTCEMLKLNTTQTEMHNFSKDTCHFELLQGGGGGLTEFRDLIKHKSVT